MVASVQELIAAANARYQRPPSKIAELSEIINSGFDAFNQARNQRMELTKQIIQQKMLEQQLEGKKQMDAEFEREVKSGFNNVKEPNDPTRAGKFQREWKVDSSGNKSYTLKPVEVANPAEDELKRAQAAYYRSKASEKAAPQEVDKAAPQEGDKAAAWNLYKTARDGLISGLEGTWTGYFVGKLPPITAEQQTAEGGVSAMAPVLKQLFRVAGEGVFTDRDQALLIGMIPTLDDLPEARMKKIQNMDRIVQAKLGLDGESRTQIDSKVMEFDSVEEAEAANLPVGTRIKIGGRSATVR